jgi:hypothetical protein
MKRLLTLLIVTFILVGCSQENGMEQALNLRKQVQDGNGCSFYAEVTADYGDTLYTFQMECQYLDDGILKFCVVQPENISGITGTVSNQGGRLTFDDKVLAFELLVDGLLSPVSTPWVVMNGISSGYISMCDYDADDLHIRLDDTYGDEPVLIDIWCSGSAPRHAEILYGGKRILSMKFEKFSFL